MSGKKKVLLGIGVVLGALVALVATMAIVGSTLPQDHVATSTVRFKKAPDEIYKLILDFESFSSWQPDCTKVEKLPEHDGHPVWREHHSQGSFTLEQIEAVAPKHIVTKIADPDLPFGGTWTFELTPKDGGTELRITENGIVKPAIFRFMAKYVFGFHKTQETFIQALGKKLGEDTAIEKS